MAQTADGMSFEDALLFISPDNATWTDCSGFGASVAIAGGERVTGEQQTMDGDTPVIKAGPRGSIDLTARYIYTEEATDPFEVLRAAHEAKPGTMYAQYSPKDGFWYSTGLGILIKPGYPSGEAESGDVLLGEFVLKCSALAKAAAST